MSTSNVNFKSTTGLKIAGTIYAPENAKGKLPAIVIAHPITSVKEQSPVNYAKPFAKAGYLALIYDATYQGESEGEPRQLEDPSARVQDIKDAVSYLLTLDNVDPERIGVLGICGSGGYAPNAVAGDLRVKAVATSAAVNFGDMIRNGYDHKLPREQFDAFLKVSKDAREAETKGEKVGLVPLIPMSKEDAEKCPPQSLLREAYDFYRTPRCCNPRAPNSIYPTSFDIASGYDAWCNVDRISPRPLLMVSGSKADTLLQSQEAIKLAKEPKELCVLDGITHVDLYDGEGAKQASAKIIEFFNKYL